ncbi:TetR/AcrR family transcriptional regulator [Zhongshania sp. BJYM1]|uniref:TetR/AcrR family transcriptional regulator n=1 Tax=Zhongshania aquatica TaxID=2965069 RepID=UPI0022B5199D|nr:TetR/AcrR family transcriptional regulator [Marortus sp. BJYM1]
MSLAKKSELKPLLNREQKNQRRKQELIDAAWTLFCEKGYEAVTIENVASIAGCSRMPVYSVFGDKQNLFLELWRRDTVAVSHMLLDALRPGVLLRDNLETLASIVAEQLQSDKAPYGEQLWFVVQTIALGRQDIAEKLQQGANRVVADVTLMVRDSTLAKGETLRSKPEQIAAQIVAQINGLTTVQFQTNRKYATKDELLNVFIAIAFT